MTRPTPPHTVLPEFPVRGKFRAADEATGLKKLLPLSGRYDGARLLIGRPPGGTIRRTNAEDRCRTVFAGASPAIRHRQPSRRRENILGDSYVKRKSSIDFHKLLSHR
ncbi:hypothetical protein FrEUN1fDRAFT_0909 [Parafrankia sp. EUN1f]|nr:hypothetical protein FrEUN1fDRAFT_0909 [Parafrankia sp. EUN1f]